AAAPRRRFFGGVVFGRQLDDRLHLLSRRPFPSRRRLRGGRCLEGRQRAQGRHFHGERHPPGGRHFSGRRRLGGGRLGEKLGQAHLERDHALRDRGRGLADGGRSGRLRHLRLGDHEGRRFETERLGLGQLWGSHGGGG